MTELFTAYYQSPLGLLRISGTEHFISEIYFIDTIEKPPGDSSKRKMPQILVQCIEQLIQYFQGQRRIFEFPIHQTGTVFQEKVWNELIGIPFGKRISYLELSRRLGDV